MWPWIESLAFSLDIDFPGPKIKCCPHRVHLAWWLSRTVYVPGGLEFEPQRLRGFPGFPGV